MALLGCYRSREPANKKAAFSLHIRNVVWIELPKSERARDSVTNLGRIAKRTAFAVKEALSESDSFVLVLEGDCTHAVGAIGGLAQAKGPPGVVWFDAHGDLNTMETTTTGFLEVYIPSGLTGE